MGFDHADARPCIRANSYTVVPAASAFEANVERRSYSRAGVAIPGSLDGWPHSRRRRPLRFSVPVAPDTPSCAAHRQGSTLE